MAENERFGREPIEIAEIGQDFCNLTYGVLPCTASNGSNFILFSEELDNPEWITVNAFRAGGPALTSPDGILLEEWVDDFQCSQTQTEINQQFTSGSSITWSVVFFDGGGFDQFDISVTIEGVDNYQAQVFPSAGAIQDNDTLPLKAFGLVDLGQGFFRAFIQTEEIDSHGADFQVTDARIRIAVGPGYVGGAMLNAVTVPPGTYAKTEAVGRTPTGIDKCFNTRSTCQDPANYDKGTLPLKFVDKRSPIPKDEYLIPSLVGVSVTPARLNPGGANRNASALGERATVTLQFQDHPHNDRLVDKYRADRSYDPFERGTFWTKWRARNPYYMQRDITLRTGYLLNGAVVDEITRAFVITGFSGPDGNGRVTIKGKDVLTLAEDTKAQAPFVSTGKLSADITAGATSATLTPAGIGDDEYAASGHLRINKEVMSFTRSGDVLTLTRSQFGTDADEHDENDTVQQCLRFVSEKPQDILFDLLNTYAGIPASFLDKAGWDAEALDFLPRLYSAIITEPEGVSKLISEMAQQMYFTIWFDERVGLVKLRAVRLAQDDEIFELDDNQHLIANSVSWKDLSDELITQVWVYYGQSNPVEKLDQADNYVAVSVTIDPLAEGPNKHNLRRIKKVFSRWIDATNASAAEDLGARILNRYGNAPRECVFSVDAKDNYLWLGEFIRLTNRLRVDTFGLPSPVNLQIFQAEESALGSEFKFTAQEFIPALTDGDDAEDPSIRNIPITSDLLNVNLRTLHDSQFGTPDGTETITFVIRQGVAVGGYAAGGGVNVPYSQRVTTNDTYDAGTSQVSSLAVGIVQILQRQGIGSVTDTAGGAAYNGGTADFLIREYPAATALDTGTWPAGVTLKLVIEAGGRLLGEGGNGSVHSLQEAVSGGAVRKGVPGGDGGHALRVQKAIEITNGGVVAGGGGGGGVVPRIGSTGYRLVPGGGGGGLEISDVSTIRTAGSLDKGPLTREAAIGSTTRGGTGARNTETTSGFTTDEIGGRGGNLAAAGDTSFHSLTTTSGGVLQQNNPGPGGAAGKAVAAGASLITWVNKGDVRGGEVA